MPHRRPPGPAAAPSPGRLQSSSPADASPMAPRGSESPRARRALTATALLIPLLLSSLPLTDAAAGSPSPSPAPSPAPLRHSLPPHAAPGGATKPHASPPPRRPGPRRQAPRHRPPPPARSSWWQQLNFGERFGIALAGVAVAMQLALGAFLCARARQLRRAAVPGKPEEHEDETAAASSSSAPPIV